MNQQKILIGTHLEEDLRSLLREVEYDRLFVLTDERTHTFCFPLLKQTGLVDEAQVITVAAGDEHKDLAALADVWMALSREGATRHSLLLNLGGGMIGDLGGFAAASFKRGIKFVNLPTTLLAMVDASVGGKTGINFDGLKNEVGVFASAAGVVIDTSFLATLDHPNILSGYAEMLKHGLLSSEIHWADLLHFDVEQIDYPLLGRMVNRSVAVKAEIVAKDPHEQYIRKALNLGHTVGHAFESLALADGRPVLHGYAVAWGLICELYLSVQKEGFPIDKFRQTVAFIKSHYGSFVFDCRQYEHLYELMLHDKKNTAGVVNFSLLGDIGEVRIDRTASKDELFEAFDFYRES